MILNRRRVMSSDLYGCMELNGVSAAANSTTSGGTTVASCSSSRWLTEEVFKLIDMVQQDEAIYNPRHKYYFCRPYVENFWRDMDLKLEKNPGACLAKWTNLRISFRREYTNYLEEKVPPCWSYFDRMFFLHPYLRKKQQQPKSLDSQMKDALDQISSISQRLQHAHAFEELDESGPMHVYESARNPHALPPAQQPEYYDETEPNNSESDEMLDEKHRCPKAETNGFLSSIKAECDETMEFFDVEPQAGEADGEEPEESHSLARNFVFEKVDSRRSSLRLPYLNRQHLSRPYHKDQRLRRSCSRESITSSQLSQASLRQRSNRTATPELMRPNYGQTVELPTSATHANADRLGIGGVPALPTSSTAAASMVGNVASAAPGTTRQLAVHHHRSEISATASSCVGALAAAAVVSAPSPTPAAPSHMAELCDCKTDPDAMFLMSLLPDIQKLNGRDRGKIKIAFQNILQDFLYPD